MSSIQQKEKKGTRHNKKQENVTYSQEKNMIENRPRNDINDGIIKQ